MRIWTSGSALLKMLKHILRIPIQEAKHWQIDSRVHDSATFNGSQEWFFFGGGGGQNLKTLDLENNMNLLNLIFNFLGTEMINQDHFQRVAIKQRLDELHRQIIIQSYLQRLIKPSQIFDSIFLMNQRERNKNIYISKSTLKSLLFHDLEYSSHFL